MNKTKKALFMQVGILAACIAVLVEDKMNNSEFIPDTTLSLDYLADDFNNLPEIQDGISEEEIKAAEQIANLMRSANPEENYNDKVDMVAGCIATYIYGWGQGKEKHFIYYRAQKIPYDNFHGDIQFLFEMGSSDGMLFLKGVPIEDIK